MSLLRKLAGETVIYGISNVAARMINFLLVPFYANILKSTGDYGVISIMYSYIGLVLVVMTFRMETGFFRFGSEKGNKGKAFSTAMISLLTTTPIIVALIILFAQPIANAIEYPDYTRYVIYLAVIVGLDTLTRVPMAKLRLDSRPYAFLTVQLTNIGVNVGLNLFFILLCPILLENGYDRISNIYDPTSLVDYVFISNIAASAVMLLMLSPQFLQIKERFDPALFKRLFWYILPLIPVGIAAVINEVIDKPMLGFLLGGTKAENDAVVGIYSANYKLAALMTIVTQGFNYAAEPFFFRNADRSDTKELYGKVGQSFAIVGSTAFLGIVLFVDIVVMILGENYRQGGDEIIPVILLANLCLGLYYNFAIWYKLKDKTIIGMYIALVGAGITLTLNFLLIPQIGFMASAWATLACYFVMMILAYALGRKYYPIHYPIPRMLVYVGLALAGYALGLGLEKILPEGSSLIWFLKAIIFVSYLFAIYLLERNGLIATLRKS